MTRITIDVPDVPYPGNRSTAAFFRDAARNLRDRYSPGGSNARIAGALRGVRWDDHVTAVDLAGAVITALADLVATMPEGLATALTRWRSALCGAADVLPHVEAERDRLKAERDGLRTELRQVNGLLTEARAEIERGRENLRQEELRHQLAEREVTDLRAGLELQSAVVDRLRGVADWVGMTPNRLRDWLRSWPELGGLEVRDRLKANGRRR